MMKKYMIGAALAALALVSCQKNMDQLPVDDGSMQFNMAWSAATKTTATAFEAGDAVGLYVVEYDGETPRPLELAGTWVANRRTVLGSTGWTSDPKIYWPASKVDVYGYYPYGAVTSIDEDPFQIAIDQTTVEQNGQLGGYEASDFLWAKATSATQEQKTVNLVYKHRMSHLVINLVKGETYEGEFPENAEIILHSTTPEAIIDMVTGTVMKAPFGKTQSIKMRKLANNKFDAIVVPQRLESNRPLIEYLANGVSYMYNSSFYFKPGKEHVLNVTINANPDQVSVEIGGQIQNWN